MDSNFCNRSLHLLVGLNLLILLLLGAWIALLFSYDFFALHSPQQTKIFIYLLNDQQNGLLNVEYLNVVEKRHLLDVKRLFINAIKVFQYSVFSVIILGVFFYKRLSGLLLKRIVARMGFMLITTSIVLKSIFGFKMLFSVLHQPFFIKNTWLFSKESQLIQLFSSEYFSQFALIYTLIVIILLYLVKIEVGFRF